MLKKLLAIAMLGSAINAMADETPLPGTVQGEYYPAPIEISWIAKGGWKLETNDMYDTQYFHYPTAGDGNRIWSQQFFGTISPAACIVEFEYQASQAFRFVMYTQTPNLEAQVPAADRPAQYSGQLTPVLLFDAEECADFGTFGDPEGEWTKVKVNLVTFEGMPDNKMPGIAKGDFAKTRFAQVDNSGDHLWIQAQTGNNDLMLYIRNFRLLDDPSSVQSVLNEESEVVASQYFDLQGRQLNAEPESGLYLRRDIRANGTAATVKAVK